VTGSGSIMKGEYTGADGHTYQWQRDGGQYRLRYMGISKVTNQHFDCWSNGIAPADIDAAFAALKELQEGGEWVELPGYGDDKFRIRTDGTQAQAWYESSPYWGDGEGEAVFDAYRAGRTTGLEDGRKEAQELAAAVLSYWERRPGHSEHAYFIALARKVKGE